MTDEEASVASSGGEQPEPEEEPEEATDPSVGLYLAQWAHAQSLIEDAKHAALSGYYAREAMHAAAERVLVGLEQLDPEQWTQRGIRKRMLATFDLGGSVGKEDMIENYRSTIGRVRMDWPYLLLRAEGELDVILRVEKTARKQADVPEMELVTSLLASVSLLAAAPEPLRRRGVGNNRVDLLENEVREAGISTRNGLDGLALALRERLAREDEDVRAANVWARAERRLPRGNAAANALLADAISAAASLEHPETLEPQDDDDVAVFVPWDDEDAHREALDEWRSWTLEEPSSLASVGRNRPGLRFDYRVDADGLVAPTAESYPHRPSGAPTVVQPASALPPVALLHDLVDGLVLGEKATAWMRSEEASS